MSNFSTSAAFTALLLLTLPGIGRAEEIKVMISGGFNAAHQKLSPDFAKRQGDTVTTTRGPSMGKSEKSIPNRLARGEPADAVIMVGYALDTLIEQGVVLADSRVELADSRIGAVVRKGAPVPQIGNEQQLREALLQAESVAYSDSASGDYIEKELFKRLGIEAQMQGKGHRVRNKPVATAVADGEYQLGFQQVSELIAEPRASFIGKIPESLQSVTRFAGGVVRTAEHPDKAQALLDYLGSEQARQVVTSTGLEAVAQ
ncbi:molybdenum ABC transporter substrate-binding protein [Stutzerimonas stutzeri]|uniref:Molybdenum ABC transporter substrate-binding protein n=1 Tax=Stutzerimonas stutzeri TaxID=316 RepID=W8R2S3_STUST|nr:substrate-binding domain-containing protein [Stutzerimonas stutzeri]AHL73823.1 molybdenum ABC transporter substrate-binding protein [Stutzerimonas stutzeri]MCQ4328661.1 substrate-binding domain-containing protein [Stutzerimonas stutzeri]